MFVSTPLSAASMEAHDQKDILQGLGRHPGMSSNSGSSRASGRPQENAVVHKEKVTTKPAHKAATGGNKFIASASHDNSSGSLPASSESASAETGASSNNTSSETGSDDNNAAENFN
jgi:hypothetical protein